MPLIRDYIAEHEQTINYGGDEVRALDRGDYDRARELLAAMATSCGPIGGARRTDFSQ